MIANIRSLKSIIVLLSVCTVIISCALGASLSRLSHPFLVVYVGIVALALIYFGWRFWWLFFPALAFIGSNINIGYKIYPEEIGFALSCCVLIILSCLNRSVVLRKNPALSSTFIVLMLYIIVHMAVSLFSGPAGLLAGAGSIIRVYAASLTWLIFSYLLYRYGTAEQIKVIFIVSIFVLFARNVISASEFFFFSDAVAAQTDTLVLPSLTELRFSALLSLYISIVVFYISKNGFVKSTIILYTVALFSLVLIGQGRVSTATAILILVIWMLLTRKFSIILPFFLVSLVLVTALYFNKGILTVLPVEAQRAISFIPAADDIELLGARNISVSDDWHNELLQLGFVRWTRSIGNVVFGNCIDPTDVKDYLLLKYDRKLEIAANTARYENTLVTLLATLGLVGFCLYVRLFWLLLKGVVPAVIKKGITDYDSSVYGVAFLSVLLMVIFIWIRGGFPGFELLFCVMAKMLFDDVQATKSLSRSPVGSV